MLFLLGKMLLACVAPVGLSDDEDVLSTPRESGPALDSGVAENMDGLAVEAWVAQSTPLEGSLEIAAGVLEASRDGGEGLSCRHTGIVAPCGDLREDTEADLGTASEVRVHYLLSSAGAAACAWEVTYRIAGIAPTDAGSVSMSMSVDDQGVDDMSTATSYEASGR